MIVPLPKKQVSPQTPKLRPSKMTSEVALVVKIKVATFHHRNNHVSRTTLSTLLLFLLKRVNYSNEHDAGSAFTPSSAPTLTYQVNYTHYARCI